MSPEAELLSSEIERQWGQARQSEDQRAALSNFIVVIAVAAQGFIVEKDFPKKAMALAVGLLVLGLFGAVALAKYYERFRLSMCRVGRLRERLDLVYPDLRLDEIEKVADAKHNGRYSVLSKVRLNIVWRVMMICIAGLGIADIVLICLYGH